MAFTEFCCRSGGSNLNGGGLASGAEPATAAVYGAVNGGWNGTTTYTPTDGSTPANFVTVGDFASVYLDAATVAVYIARVTTVNPGVNGTIILSSTAKSGAAPSSLGSGRSIKVGGAWKGPNGAETFPIGFVAAAMTDVAGDYPRINFKNNTTYSITAATTAAAGPCIYQGYSSSFNDGGKATIDGGTSGASYILFTNGADVVVADMIFQNNGASGNAQGVNFNGARSMGLRLVINNVRGNGIVVNGTSSTLIQGEAYLCNQSNTASTAGMVIAGGAWLVRCISHDNSGSNSSGFFFSGSGVMANCISDTNGAKGFLAGNTQAIMLNCDAYNNVSDGFNSTTSISAFIQNCNFIKNGGWGINCTTATNRTGFVMNCGFGSGSQANTLGTTNLLFGIVESGSVTYPSGLTPWQDPANGDFRITLPAAMNAGIGAYTETQAGYAGTVGYPDIGAAQHIEIPNRPTVFGYRSKRG
jgi:hypothetical protein